MASIFRRLLNLFSFRKQPPDMAPPAAPPAEAPLDIAALEKAAARPPVAAAPPKQIPDKIRVPETNRHGLPLIHPSQDLNALFAEPPRDDSNRKENVRVRSRDRHGIPRLGPSDDIFKLFGEQNPDAVARAVLSKESKSRDLRRFGPGADGNFARMLDRQLAGKSLRDLLREKTDGAQPMPLPASVRIKRYPKPQAELDLHGETARRAVEKTARFIESSGYHGLLTLRIIVGKGSHSADGPVLPDAVGGKLSELKSSGRILDFRWERQGRSRGGAVIVYLNEEASCT